MSGDAGPARAGAPVDTSTDHRWWTPVRRHYVLVMLCLVGLLNFADRQIIAILLEPISRDLRLSDTMMGLLTGIAFSAVYVIAGIPIARLADTGSRRRLLTICLSLWTVTTMLCAFASSFWQLALVRVGVAAAQSGGAPATQSMLADLYPARQRSTVIGIWSAAQSLGIAIGLFAGGAVNAWLGWRAAFLIVGAPGLLLAVIFALTVREPLRGMSDTGLHREGGAMPTTAQALRFVLRSSALRTILFISMTCSIAGYSVLTWGPTFFVRVHGMTTAAVGLYMGIGLALGLISGNLCSGYLADRLAKGDFATYMKFSGWATLLAVPTGLIFTRADSIPLSMTGLFAAAFFMTFWLPPTYAVAMGLTPPRMRGLISALIAYSGTLIGVGLGPLLVGALTDIFRPSHGDMAIREALTFALAGLGASGLLCFLAVRPVRAAAQALRVADGG
ncbi:MAG: MFS transporter [Sphingobium sp.]